MSAPVIMAAHSLGIHTVIHEQNSIVGKANQLVMKKVDAIITCYENVMRFFQRKRFICWEIQEQQLPKRQYLMKTILNH